MISPSNQIRLIKMLDISILGNIYFLCGVFVSIVLEGLFPKFDKEEYDKKSSVMIYLELALIVALIMIFAYLIRITIKKIPFLFDGVQIGDITYNHAQLKELNGGILYAFSILLMQKNFKDKTLYLINRVKNNLSENKVSEN
jgi:hypothetical protein